MAHFYGWGSSASRLEPVGEGSLLFTISFQKLLLLILSLLLILLPRFHFSFYGEHLQPISTIKHYDLKYFQ